MSDYNSGLPVRTQADADERLQTKIVDATTPAQQMTVDTDGNAHVEVHGNDPAGTDRVLKVSEDGAVAVAGVYDVSANSEPASIGVVAHARASTPSDSDQTKRLTAITNSTVHALDVSLHDETGAPYSSSNPLPVVLLESEGTEVNSAQTSSAVAVGATANLDYTVTSATTLQLTQVVCSASGKAKFEVKTETASGSGVFTSRFVLFNSTATPVVDLTLKDPISVVAGAKVRVIVTNRDTQAQDVYATICGHEV